MKNGMHNFLLKDVKIRLLVITVVQIKKYIDLK